MSIYKTQLKISTVDNLITSHAKGNVDFLAKNLGLQRAATYLFINEMREVGFPISYSKKENRFYYSEKGKMVGFSFVKDIEKKSGK